MPVSMQEFLDNDSYTLPQDKPRPNNRKILIDFFDNDYEELLYVAGIGSGKCLGKGTKVLMFDGSVKKVEDIQQREQLMGDDSTPRTVLSLTQGQEELFKVIPVKGDSFVVNKSHILSTKVTRRYKTEPVERPILNLSVSDYVQLSKKKQNLLKLWRTGVEFEEQETTISPYFLGLWLGDGNSHNVGVTKGDQAVIDAVHEEADKWGLQVNVNKNNHKSCGCHTITTGSKNGGHLRNPLLNEFNRLKLINNKHIPQHYLINSKAKRLELLAGLIDSDGWVSNSYVSYSTIRKPLAEQVAYLCRSLGLAAYVKEHNKFVKYLGRRYKSFSVSISGDLSVIPTRIPRKQSKPRQQIKSVMVTGFKIEPIGVGDYYGFELDKNHLYLLGDFTITHNSYLSSMAISYVIYKLLCLKNPQKYFDFARGTKIAFINISTSYEQAKNVVFTEIKNRIDNNAWFQANYPPDWKIKSALKFPKNIFILPLGSNEESPLGYNIFGAIIDEASFHTQTKDKDYAEESYNQIKARIKSRFFNKGRLFIITSSKYVHDFAETKFRDDNNPKLYKIRVPLWEALPANKFCGQKFDASKYLQDHSGVMVPVEFEQEFIRNPEKAMRDLGAQPSLSIQGFFRDPNIIRDFANKNRNHPWSKKDNDFHKWFYNVKGTPYYDTERYYIHIDLGLNRKGKGDAAGIAMGKFAGWEKIKLPDGKIEIRPKIYIAYMERIEAASTRDEIKFEDIRKRIYRLKEIGYNVYKASFDGWQSADSIQILNSAGIKAELLSVDKNIQPYYTLKESLLEGRLDYYGYDPFITECQHLEEVKGNKVDHPMHGSKDVSDAVAGVCYHCSKFKPGTGILGASS